MEDRRAEMFAKLGANQNTRLEERQKRRDETAAERDPAQSAEAFWRVFTPQLEGVTAVAGSSQFDARSVTLPGVCVRRAACRH